VFQASIAVGSLLGGVVVGILGDRGAIWTGTVFAALALLGFGLFARPVPPDPGQAGPKPADGLSTKNPESSRAPIDAG
jgi:hypothetical protein